jgi:hypothetical protein
MAAAKLEKLIAALAKIDQKLPAVKQNGTTR